MGNSWELSDGKETIWIFYMEKKIQWASDEKFWDEGTATHTCVFCRMASCGHQITFREQTLYLMSKHKDSPDSHISADQMFHFIPFLYLTECEDCGVEGITF